MKRSLLSILTIAVIMATVSCKKSNQEFQSASLSEYYPLETGKYITYNLDSLVYINFGTSSVIRSYQVKYEVDAQITDNLGRPAYRIIRYRRDTPTAAWAPDNTFMAVNSGSSLEFIENNLRFLKLKLPVVNNYSWKGNSFIDTYSSSSPVRYLDDWDYMYDSVAMPIQLGSFNLDNTLTVKQRDEVIGNPNDPNLYSEINYSQEKYAAGIGLVYRKFYHAEYQPPVPNLGGYYVDGSYGVTLTMIDHN